MSEHERAARYSDLFGDRPAAHASDCAYCPFCATVAVVRQSHPEVMEHLAAAARELITAAGILVEEAARVVAPSGAASAGPQTAAPQTQGAEGAGDPPEAEDSPESSNVRRIDAV